jgi:hypothetical protein
MLIVATCMAVVALCLLALRPAWGVPAVFIVRPLVDTTYAEPLLGALRLTEIVSAAVPILVLAHMCVPGNRSKSLAQMPLKWFWIAWSLDVAIFSTFILFNNDIADGFNVFFRHISGFAGFYMVQAYLADDRGSKRFLIALVIAGLFPMATGVYEAVSGHHWKVTLGEDGLIRNIGMYHDAITIRYLALQSILAAALLSALYWQRKYLANVGLLAFGVVCVFVLYGAYSKAGLLTLGAWLVLWPLLLRRAGVLLLLAICAIPVVIYLGPDLLETAARVFNKEIAVLGGDAALNRSFSGRWYIWEDMFRQWTQFSAMQQIFGSGHIGTGAHNDYLNVLFHGGIVGLLLYVALLLAISARVLRNLLRTANPWNVAAALAVIMWLVDTVGLVPSAYSGYQWFAWGIVGLAFKRHELALGKRVRRTRPAVVTTNQLDDPLGSRARVVTR